MSLLPGSCFVVLAAVAIIVGLWLWVVEKRDGDDKPVDLPTASPSGGGTVTSYNQSGGITAGTVNIGNRPPRSADLCTRCHGRFGTEVVTLGPVVMGLVCFPCLDDVMFTLSLTEPEGRDGYASWRAAAGLPDPVRWPGRETPAAPR